MKVLNVICPLSSSSNTSVLASVHCKVISAFQGTVNLKPLHPITVVGI